jgi:hypothetical protein
MADAKVEAKRDETPIKVRCMKDVYYAPEGKPHLAKLYKGPNGENPGEELVIPKWRFTDWHVQEEVVGKNGKSMFVRGAFEMADRPVKPVDALEMTANREQALYAENQELLKKLAELQAAKDLTSQEKRSPGKLAGKKDEI